MKRKKAFSKGSGKDKKKKRTMIASAANSLSLHTELTHFKKQFQKLWEQAGRADERLQDIEIHLNLLTRLLTTLCVEKFGMRIGVLKRMIKRIEKEAIRDSQILHLEELYKLPPHTDKKGPAPQPPSKSDPWEEIS